MLLESCISSRSELSFGIVVGEMSPQVLLMLLI